MDRETALGSGFFFCLILCIITAINLEAIMNQLMALSIQREVRTGSITSRGCILLWYLILMSTSVLISFLIVMNGVRLCMTSCKWAQNDNPSDQMEDWEREDLQINFFAGIET